MTSIQAIRRINVRLRILFISISTFTACNNLNRRRNPSLAIIDSELSCPIKDQNILEVSVFAVSRCLATNLFSFEVIQSTSLSLLSHNISPLSSSSPSSNKSTTKPCTPPRHPTSFHLALPHLPSPLISSSSTQRNLSGEL